MSRIVSLNKSNKASKNQTPLRVGVVGVGMMGRHHARVYSMMQGVDLIGVFDVDAHRAQTIAETYGCLTFQQVEEFIGKVDAVSIAVPSHLHAKLGSYFLNNNIHCLIEKPLAIRESECLELINLAYSKDLILAVGHIEHFNPAVQQLMKIFSEGHHIQAIDIQRMSASSSRITDVDVVLDLMIHDLEIVQALVKQPVLKLSAQAVAHSPMKGGADYVSALLSFVGGSIANVTASRITQNKIRKLSITSEIGYITLDYNTQELFIYRQPIDSTLLNNGSYISDRLVEKVLVQSKEPLFVELQNFVQSINLGNNLGVTGRQALEALKLVWKIQESILPTNVKKPKLKKSREDVLIQ